MSGNKLLTKFAVGGAIIVSALAMGTTASAAEPVWQGPVSYHCPRYVVNGVAADYTVYVQPTYSTASTFGPPRATYRTTYGPVGYLQAQAKVNESCNHRPPADPPIESPQPHN